MLKLIKFLRHYIYRAYSIFVDIFISILLWDNNKPLKIMIDFYSWLVFNFSRLRKCWHTKKNRKSLPFNAKNSYDQLHTSLERTGSWLPFQKFIYIFDLTKFQIFLSFDKIFSLTLTSFLRNFINGKLWQKIAIRFFWCWYFPWSSSRANNWIFYRIFLFKKILVHSILGRALNKN